MFKKKIWFWIPIICLILIFVSPAKWGYRPGGGHRRLVSRFSGRVGL